jgi:ribosomal protein L11 methylase PrmA
MSEPKDNDRVGKSNVKKGRREIGDEITLSIANIIMGVKAIQDLGTSLEETELLFHLEEETSSIASLRNELDEQDQRDVLDQLESALVNFIETSGSNTNSEKQVEDELDPLGRTWLRNTSELWLSITQSTTSNQELIFTEKSIIKRIAETVMEIECLIAKAWSFASHKRLFAAQWLLSPTPEWFDHSMDLYYQWSKTNNSLWVERGVFGGLALKGERLLELSCGDGFNAKHFYSHRSKEVVACDFDPLALRTANLKNNASNIKYVLADIRTQMPDGKYENIVWDAAIEHFTPDEIISIMSNLKSRLTDDGVLSGHTLVEKSDGSKHIHQHEYEFKDMEDLKRFISPYFENVKVFETIYPSRHNLYFWASDSLIPFDTNWPQCV